MLALGSVDKAHRLTASVLSVGVQLSGNSIARVCEALLCHEPIDVDGAAALLDKTEHVPLSAHWNALLADRFAARGRDELAQRLRARLADNNAS